MCGIAGILAFDPQRTANSAVLDRCLQAIFHRGPDEDGRLIDRELAMGMRRLSIIDLADGQQPFSMNPDDLPSFSMARSTTIGSFASCCGNAGIVW